MTEYQIAHYTSYWQHFPILWRIEILQRTAAHSWPSPRDEVRESRVQASCWSMHGCRRALNRGSLFVACSDRGSTTSSVELLTTWSMRLVRIGRHLAASRPRAVDDDTGDTVSVGAVHLGMLEPVSKRTADWRRRLTPGIDGQFLRIFKRTMMHHRAWTSVGFGRAVCYRGLFVNLAI